MSIFWNKIKTLLNSSGSIMSILPTHKGKCPEFEITSGISVSYFQWCCGCRAMCEGEQTGGKKMGGEEYHLDRQRRDSTLLGRIINRLSHGEFSKQLTHFTSHALTCNISAFTKVYHHPSAASRFNTQTWQNQNSTGILQLPSLMNHKIPRAYD